MVISSTVSAGPNTGWATWRAFFGMGLLNNVIPFVLIVWGQGHVGSGVASILNATTPVFTVIVAHFLTQDERLTPGRLAGVGAGLAGVAVMMGGGPAVVHGVEAYRALEQYEAAAVSG